MGFFGSSKTVGVASVVYNLAGDENERPDYLKTVVTTKILADTNPTASMGETITGSYLGGPGMRLRTFIKWANYSGYNDLIGLEQASFYLLNDVDLLTVIDNIPHPPGQTVNIVTTEIGVSDFSWWADQYMIRNHPDLVNTDWVSDFNEATGQITITLADEVTQYVFTPLDYIDDDEYLYVVYNLTGDPEAGPIVTGTVVSIGSGDPFPSTVGWTENSYSSVPTDVDLDETVDVLRTYSDGRPDETDHDVTTSTGSYDEIAGEYEKTEYLGSTGDGGPQTTKSLRSIMYQNQTASVSDAAPDVVVTVEDIGGGVMMTTTTTTVQQILTLDRSYRIDTQEITNATFYGADIFIYRKDSGIPDLDTMFALQESAGMYAPFIPVRINNVSITDPAFDDYYPMSKKAYKKAVNSKFAKLIEKVEDNEELGDIDYTYCVFGVSLNVKENACKKYIYKFFETLLESSSESTAAYSEYQVQMEIAQASQDTWLLWVQAQSDSSNPLFGTIEPVKIPYPDLPINSIRIKGNTVMNYDMTVTLSALVEDEGVGMFDAEHKVGDLWFTVNEGDQYEQYLYLSAEASTVNLKSIDYITLYWQESPTKWRAMHIWGLGHINRIYKGKAVKISAKEALEDLEESGFIIPLNRDIYTEMSLVDATQMSTACMFLVFNCYKVVKKKWYQTSIFQIVVIVIVIVLTIVFPPSAGAGGGVIAGMGAAIGLSGLALAIFTAVVTALAAMIVVRLIGAISTKIFGDKVGAIVGAVASVIALAVGGNYLNGGSLVGSISALASPVNILALTNAVGNGYAGYIQAATQETIAATQQVLEEYDEQSAAIAEQFGDVIGRNRGIIDPIELTKATSLMYETADSFLSRTLMAGSDIAELSQVILLDFVRLTLNTSLTFDVPA